MSMEIEQRFKVRSVEKTKRLLAEQGVFETGQQHLIDEWFVPGAIRSQEDQDRWFDDEHGTAYRIRRTEQSDGTFSVVLDSKQLTDANNHNTFHEEVVLRDNYKSALDLLAEKHYYNWLTIDKVRLLFSRPSPELEVIIDTIGGFKPRLGFDTAIEIEYKGSESRDEALSCIGALAVSIGCKPEDRFEKSLTVAAMEVLARFKY